MKRLIPALITVASLGYAAVVWWRRLELAPWQATMLAQLAGIVALLALVGAAGVLYVVAVVKETWEGWRDAD